jgi:hypothetical protein
MENLLAETEAKLKVVESNVVFDFDKTLINPDTTLGFFLFEQFWARKFFIFMHGAGKTPFTQLLVWPQISPSAG